MTNKNKVFIAEISDELINNKFFLYSAFVWALRTDNDYSSFVNAEYDAEGYVGITSPSDIIAITVQNIQLQRVYTIADVQANEGTFYYLNKFLLVHFEESRTPYSYSAISIRLGFALGFFNSISGISSAINNTQYYPRLLEGQLIQDIKDDVYEGKQKYPTISIEIENGDLKFKNFNVGSGVKRKIGVYTRLLFWEGNDISTFAYGDCELVYQGVINKVIEGTKIILELKDLRNTLKEKTPGGILNAEIIDPDVEPPTKNGNFPYIDEGTYTKPQIWGKCYRVPVICLNEEANDDVDVLDGGIAVPNYDFMICDISKRNIASDSIKKIYIDDKLTSLTATVQKYTSDNIAYFSIAESNFRKASIDDDGVTVTSISWENMSKVSIDVEGYVDQTISTTNRLIENGLEVIRSIIFDVYGKSFTDTFYDKNAWTLFENLAYKVGYYLDEPKSVQEQIEELSSTQLGQFVYDKDLRYSFNNYDYSDLYPTTIEQYMLMPKDFRLTIKSDPEKVLNKFRVGYQRRWAISDKEKEYLWDVDTSNSENAILNYNSYKESDFKTLLTDTTDLIDFKRRLLDEFGDSFDTFNIVVPWEFRGIKAGWFIQVRGDYINVDYLGYVICQVQSIKPNVEKWNVGMEVRIKGYLPYLVDELGNYIVDELNNVIIGA